MYKCEVCKRKVNVKTMKVYVVEHKEPPYYLRKALYYCTDCTRCGSRIVLKEKFNGNVVDSSESEVVAND